MITIYRYYDEDNKSYIGQTKQSLKKRAGKDGKNYTKYFSKFSDVIKRKGFSSFKVEILEQVEDDDQNKADELEKYYIKKYDSMNNGYNSTYGGTKAYFYGIKTIYLNDLYVIKYLLASTHIFRFPSKLDYRSFSSFKKYCYDIEIIEKEVKILTRFTSIGRGFKLGFELVSTKETNIFDNVFAQYVFEINILDEEGKELLSKLKDSN